MPAPSLQSQDADRPCNALPLLSIVVPVFNHLEYTQAMLASLRATMPAGMPYEVVLVDDGSTDGTRDWLKTLSEPDTQVLINERNLGFAASNNRGASVARGECLALLNNDLILNPGWLEPMLAVLNDRTRDAGLVGNVQLRASDKAIDHAGITVTRLGKLEHIQTKPSANTAVVEALAVTAACCLVRKADFDSVGGFDESYFNGGEDIDLAFKLRERGKRSYVALRSSVLHHVSATRGPTSLQDERNSRRLYQRWAKALGAAIATEWAKILAAPESSACDRLAAFLVFKGLTRNPPRKARLLAQSALWREEARWRALFESPVPPTTPVAVRVSGLKISAPGSPPYIGRKVRVRLPAGTPHRNLFICGHLSPGDPDAPITQRPLGLRVTINGIQSVEWFPLAEGNFNLAIDAPASLPDRITCVWIELLGHGGVSWLLPFAFVLGVFPMSAAWRSNLLAVQKRHLHKRLRLSKIVCDDRNSLDLLDEFDA
ncbi:MAG: glycosyltransferase family 2 protein [Opitutaceae bacterium]